MQDDSIRIAKLPAHGSPLRGWDFQVLVGGRVSERADGIPTFLDDLDLFLQRLTIPYDPAVTETKVLASSVRDFTL